MANFLQLNFNSLNVIANNAPAFIAYPGPGGSLDKSQLLNIRIAMYLCAKPYSTTIVWIGYRNCRQLKLIATVLIKLANYVMSAIATVHAYTYYFAYLHVK